MTRYTMTALVALLGLAAAAEGGAETDAPLAGRTVGVLIADGFDVGETRRPIEYLRERGAEAIIVGMERGEVRSGRQAYTIARTVDEATLVEDLDALVIPGGTSPAKLREDKAVLDLVRRFAATGKPLAAICHGPQVLISAGLLQGRRATCVVVDYRDYFAVRDELIAAGAIYVNQPVVTDGNIITSRLPWDVLHFSVAIGRALGDSTAPPPQRGAAWIGDFGHYLTAGTTRIHMLNTEERRRPLAVTLHRYNWVLEPGTRWNNPRLRAQITGPDGELVNTHVETHEEGVTIEVPAAEKGVYTLRVASHELNYWHMTTSSPDPLPYAVASASRQHPFTAVPMVPRRWYFFVPEETDYFTVRTWSHGGRSQREDHGITVRSPQGQRMGVLWDNPNPQVRDGEILWGRDRRDLEQELHIVVEPGASGRFWSLDVQMGDAHIFSNFPLALERVPPYLAPSPEQWFNPDTAEAPPPKRYEDTPFVRKVLPEDAGDRWPHFAHWMPGAPGGRKDWMYAPALGSNASNQLRTPSTFALWNPEGRDLLLYLADYVPRDPRDENVAKLRIFDADGKLLESKHTPPISHGSLYEHALKFEGVRLVEVDRIERFWAFTYPGTPVVLVGDEAEDDWKRFRIESGARRHWYFRVPEGTTAFQVRVGTPHPQEVVSLDVNAPDRTVARIYAASDTAAVAVPPGLDGKIWHLSIGVGTTTRYFPADDRARNPVIPLDLEIKGVPAYLSPTWEQWFDPRAVR